MPQFKVLYSDYFTQKSEIRNQYRVRLETLLQKNLIIVSNVISF